MSLDAGRLSQQSQARHLHIFSVKLWRVEEKSKHTPAKTSQEACTHIPSALSDILAE